MGSQTAICVVWAMFTRPSDTYLIDVTMVHTVGIQSVFILPHIDLQLRSWFVL